MKLFVVIATFLLCSFGQPVVNSEKEYHQWYQKQTGTLIQKEYINDFKLVARYIPRQYNLYQLLQKQDTVTEKVADSARKALEDTYAFSLAILPDTSNDLNVQDYLLEDSLGGYPLYHHRMKLLQELAGFNIRLEVAGQTFYAREVQLTGPAPGEKHLSLRLTYKHPFFYRNFHNAGWVNLVVDDNVLLSSRTHFRFYRKDMEDIPELNFGPLKKR